MTRSASWTYIGRFIYLTLDIKRVTGCHYRIGCQIPTFRGHKGHEFVWQAFAFPLPSSMSVSGSPTSSSPFDFGTRLGLVFVVEVASLSATAVVSLLAFICYSAVKAQSRGLHSWAVSTHIHYYFVNLLACDLIQAIGGIMDIRWIAEANVTEGPFCTAQGIFKQLGDLGVALSIMSIAIHTFLVLVFRCYSQPKVAPLVVALIWTFLGLAVGVSLAKHHGERFYGSTTYWCWITTNYRTEQSGSTLVLKGILLVDGYKIRLRRRSDASDVNSDIDEKIGMSHSVQRSNAIAMQMLFYPAVYLVAIFPMSLVRWLSFYKIPVPFIATAFASILFSSSGILNVTLFTLTRPGLVLNRGPSNSQRSCEYHGSIPSPGAQSGYRHPPVSPRTLAEDNIEEEGWKCCSHTEPGGVEVITLDIVNTRGVSTFREV
ncbi:hypothetical protein EV421DRAFT_1904510 [Armillaria borealis]|uniref:Glucose receptor Git3 N-terminal domain-containing protein n=1 Tax=Armillaria borealis TaxID=47425 RepID=A0AA39JIG4_9AGAR|nr:hypothetical protein EV421DRAFT_1904510 [Armillaria borealis]